MKQTNDKMALILVIILLMLGSFYTGKQLQIEKGKEYGVQDYYELRRMSTECRFELNRCRGWVDDMGAQVMKERR